ncbi:MAG: hypothetical protein JW982_06905 [Spirochaetes bacterium]|nr:hypothetical protein [Spirochaetota bacterium]
MKKLLIMIFMISAVSCMSPVKMKSEIRDFKIEVIEIPGSSDSLVKITGKSMDSALWIRSYRIEYKGKNVYVNLDRSLQPTGISSPYYLEFLIPDETENIYLGKNEIIWER